MISNESDFGRVLSGCGDRRVRPTQPGVRQAEAGEAGAERRRFVRPTTGPRPSLYTRLHEVKPCHECRASEGGLWAVDRETGRVVYGRRCHCLRGQLLAKADVRRGLGSAA